MNTAVATKQMQLLQNGAKAYHLSMGSLALPHPRFHLHPLQTNKSNQRGCALRKILNNKSAESKSELNVFLVNRAAKGKKTLLT